MADLDRSITQFPLGNLTTESLFVASDVGSGVPYESNRHPASEIADKMLNNFEYNDLTTDDKTVFGSINELAQESLSAVITGTLTAGQTSVTLSDNRIKADSLLCYYTDPFGINPIGATATNGSVTLTFEEQSSDVGVAVEIRGVPESGGGGGSDDPTFTETLICDNTSLASSLTFTDDYTDYEFIKFVIYNSSSQRYTEILTTPEMITNSFTYSNSLLNLNEVGNDQYCCYNSSWSRTGKRNCDVYEVYGLNCSNKTTTKTTLYNRQAISTSAVTITSATSLFDYDYIVFGSCTGSYDETEPCNEVFKVKDDAEDIFGRAISTRYLSVNAYNRIVGVRLSEYEISSWAYYFFVQGITFS